MQNLQNIQNMQGFHKTRKLDPFQKLFGAISGTSDLVAYYPLNEDSGDAINRAPDTFGSLNATVTGATQGVAGQVGKAYSFDGGDVLTIADDDLLEVTDFTFLCMFKLDTLHENGSARKELVKQDPPYIFNLNANGTIEFAVNNGGGYDAMFSTKASWAADTWFMVALVNNSSTGRTIYVNGVSNNTGSAQTPTSPTSSMFLFAADAGGTDGFVGAAQHVALVGRAMGAAELLQLARTAGLA